MVMEVLRRIFSGGELREELNQRLRNALAAVDKVDADRILDDEGAVIDELLDHYSLRPVSVDWDSLDRDPVGEATRGFKVRFHVQGSGEDLQAWEKKPTHSYADGVPVGLLDDGRLTFVISGSNVADINMKMEQRRRQVDTMVEASTNDITNANQELRGYIARQTSQRKARLQEMKALDAALDIPLRATAAEKRIEVPVKRKRVRVTEQPAKAGASKPTWQLADEIYEDVVRIVRSLGTAFERLPRTSAHFGEDEYRDLILFVLNTHYEGGARGEVFNGQGKTDILLPWEDRNAFIGECKVWHGAKKFNDAIDQLLSYTVWRDTKAALIIFIKEEEPTAIIAKADAALRGHACFVSADDSPADATARADYRLHAIDDPDQVVQVALLPVVIREPSDEG